MMSSRIFPIISDAAPVYTVFPFDEGIFIRDLEKWVNGGSTDGEKTKRADGASEIFTCYMNEEKDLTLKGSWKTQPKVIGHLTWLQNLNICSSAPILLPKEITELTQLKTLKLSGKIHHTSFARIGCIISLQHLHLNHSNLEEFPSSIYSLIHLKTLDISNNKLNSVSDKINKLQELKILNVSHNHLQSLPYVTSLTKIVHLDLSHNCLDSLPRTISTFTQLEILDLEDNRISRLSRNIASLTSLKVLSARRNQISSVARAIGKLTQLQTLLLAENSNLTSLPEEIENLTKLEYLDLMNCGFKSLPEKLFNLPSDTMVEITDCPLIEDDEIREALNNKIQAENYTGPKIFCRAQASNDLEEIFEDTPMSS
jgi:Leucine-rich repeat (LRR) protein